jgi:ribosome-associated protein
MRISTEIEIPESEITESFIRGGGPGGQNINKVATAVQLRFNLLNSTALPTHVISRIMQHHHNWITKDGELIIEAAQFRTQRQNRESARQKLRMIVVSQLKPKKKRIKTKPSRRARQSRLDSKKKHSQKKSLRNKNYPE